MGKYLTIGLIILITLSFGCIAKNTIQQDGYKKMVPVYTTYLGSSAYKVRIYLWNDNYIIYNKSFIIASSSLRDLKSFSNDLGTFNSKESKTISNETYKGYNIVVMELGNQYYMWFAEDFVNNENRPYKILALEKPTLIYIIDNNRELQLQFKAIENDKEN
jgi:hypothetical protein